MPIPDPSVEFRRARLWPQGEELARKVEIKLGSTWYEIPETLDISNISRSVSWETGKFSPGSCSVTIDNKQNKYSDNNPDSIFYQTEYLGAEIRISLGFKLIDGSKEYVIAWQGIINEKSDNLKNKTIEINSYDVLRDALNFKLGRVMRGSDFFEYESATSEDMQKIQTVIALGKHELPNNFSKEILIKDDPFNLTICISPANGTLLGGTGKSRRKSYSTYENYGVYWLIPIDNDFDTIAPDTAFYFWDYKLNKWYALGGTGERTTFADGGFQYVKFTSATQTRLGYTTFNWSDYINGINAWAGTESPNENLAPKVAIRTSTNSSQTIQGITLSNLNNPVLQMAYLLLSDRYVEFDKTLLDISSFLSPDETFSFDKSYRILEQTEILTCVNIKKEITLLDALQAICEISNTIFITTENQSASEDRRLRLHYDQPVYNPETLNLNTENIETIALSRKDSELNNKATMIGFDYSINTGRESFDVYTREDITSQSNYGIRENKIGSDSIIGATAFLYDSRYFAEDMLYRILRRLSSPEESASIDCDFIALCTFPKIDIVVLTDPYSGLDLDYQIKNKSVKANGKISLELARYGKTFGIDPLDKTKLWGFADYAYIDEDLDGNTYYAY